VLQPHYMHRVPQQAEKEDKKYGDGPENLRRDNLSSRINSFKILKEILGQSAVLYFANNV